MDNILFDQNSEPYSLEAEQAVLGSLLMDPDCLLSIADITKPEHFYIPQHREIFSIIINLDAIGQKFDALLVLEELKARAFMMTQAVRIILHSWRRLYRQRQMWLHMQKS